MIYDMLVFWRCRSSILSNFAIFAKNSFQFSLVWHDFIFSKTMPKIWNCQKISVL